MSRHCIITGCSRGIGKAIAGRLIEDGHRVTGTRRSAPFPKDFESNSRFNGLRADLAENSDIEDILGPLLKSGEADVLINNAGIFTDAAIWSDDSKWLDVWDRTQQVNLRAPALLTKWFVNACLEKKKEGIVINIASRAAYRGDTQEYAAYAASKAGLTAFTKSLARNLGKSGIVAYTIAPGFIETDMALESVEVLGREALTRDSAFDEITTPEEVAAIVSFLAKGEVKHMTGSTLHINGGSYMI